MQQPYMRSMGMNQSAMNKEGERIPLSSKKEGGLMKLFLALKDRFSCFLAIVASR